MKLRQIYVLVCLLLACSLSAAQDVNDLEYVVKFVCGRRVMTTANRWQAVAPGNYWTAINILSRARFRHQIRFDVSTTVSSPESGVIIARPHVTVPPQHALEFDCSDIFDMIGSRNFVKGFVVVHGSAPLDVTVVHTAAGSEGVTSIHVKDVASALAQAPCAHPDLTIALSGPPSVTLTETAFTVIVQNIGTRNVRDVKVLAEDRTLNVPQRQSEQTLPLVVAGESVTVTLTLPFLISQERLRDITLLVATKPPVDECREDNNRINAGQ